MKKNNRGLVVLLIGVFLSLVAPTVLTHCNLSDWFDLSKDEYANIGSAIGGITAPIVGLAGAYLLYLTLMENKKTNELTNIQSNINWVRDTISRNNILRYNKNIEPEFRKSDALINAPLKAIADTHFDSVLQIAKVLNVTVKEVNKGYSEYLKLTLLNLIKDLKECQVYRAVDESSICLMDESGEQFFPSTYIYEAWSICESWNLIKSQKI